MTTWTISSYAGHHRLASLARIKSDLGITDSSQDAALRDHLDAVGEAFGEQLNRPPWRQGYTLKVPGHGDIWLLMPVWPVEAVSAITAEGGVAVEATSYEVSGQRRDRLYRRDGWSWTAAYGGHLLLDRDPGSERLDYIVNLTAGWVLAPAWVASAAVRLGEWARPTTYLPGGLLFECTTAGTSAGTEPTWPTTVGNTVADGTVTWTARAAHPLPRDLETAALETAVIWWRGHPMQRDPGLISEERGSVALEYGAAPQAIPAPAMAVLERYR